jgi:glycosyltransferase involved in cell wall biosynthesis
MSRVTAPSLAFYLPRLDGGGAERAVLALAGAFAGAGRDVRLVVGRREGALAGAVPAAVRCTELGRGGTAAGLPALTRYVRQARPAVLVSGLGHNNIAAILAARAARTGTRVVVCQHNALAQECAPGRSLRFRLLPLGYRLALPFAHAAVAVSDGVAREMETLCRRPYGSIHTLYNPAWSREQAAQAEEATGESWLDDGGEPVILGVGRLVPQKDFATLIRAFAMARTGGMRARLLIVGEGPERDALQAQIDRLGVTGTCRLAGFRPNPAALMARARLLVMSSRYEGFGNVLVEALGCGTPVVSTDCPHGPAEIVGGGRFGRLVPVGDVAALADAMVQALDAPPDRARLRARAQDFSLERSVAQYAALFDRLVS